MKKASSLVSDRQSILKLKLANLYFLQSKFSKALVSLRELLFTEPKNVEAWILAGDIYFKRKDFRKALENYKSALNYDQKDTVVRGRINLIKSIILKQNFPKQKASNGSHPIVISIEVERLFFLKNYEKAKLLIEKNLKFNPKSPKLLLLKAKTYEKLGFRSKAIKGYKNVLKINPDWLDVYDSLAGLYLRAGMFRKAINVYKVAGAIHKTNVDMYLKAAKLYQKKGLFKGSRQFLEKILKKHPDSKLLLSELGELFWKAKQIDKSKKYYEKLLLNFPDSHRAMNRLAWFCSLKMNCLDEGIKMSRKSLELSPDNPSYFDTLAELHYKKGELKKSYQYIKKAILIEPKNMYYRLQLRKFKKK
ncbi:MAG: tetratricopeptide repeat protein [Nitrospinota bacterium]|nr:tetratricopeptide repeat protein [Nitrospinota bacterium]